MKNIKDLQKTELIDAVEATNRLVTASKKLNKYLHDSNESQDLDYETVLPLLTSVRYFYEQVSELCVRYECMEEVNASVEESIS